MVTDDGCPGGSEENKIWEGTEARMDLIFKIRGYVYTFFKDLKYRIAL